MFPAIKFSHGLKFHSISQFLHHCSQTNNLKSVKEFFAHSLGEGLFFISPNLQTQLVLAYTSCVDKNSSLTTLTSFFKCLGPRNPLPFNSIIAHFAGEGSHSLAALHVFSYMQHNSIQIDSYALCCSLKSISCLKNLPFGKMVHAHMEKSGWMASVFAGSALVDFYAKLQRMDDAAILFDEIPEKNTVCVNALLSGYAEGKLWARVIKQVQKMPALGLSVDNFTLSAALRACSGLCSVNLGKQVHARIICSSTIDIRADVFLQCLLMGMYGKCGLVVCAEKVFEMAGYGVKERKKDVVLWTSMFGVYGKSGNFSEVIQLFRNMLMQGICPDGVSFLTVISACSHTGQVDLGMEYFESMKRTYGLVMGPEHYSCLVDLLCRAGELERACAVIDEMPYNGDESRAVSLWGALLNACNECGNIGLGKVAAQRALELEPDNVGVYVLLSNMYAGNGMWAEIEELRELMKSRGLKKDTGWSWADGTG